MEIRIEKSFEFRAPTRREWARERELFKERRERRYLRLPQFVDETDIHHLNWCDSGLFLILRQLFSLIPDGRSVRGDRIPKFDDVSDSHINDPMILTARFRHLFFGDIPRDISLQAIRIAHRGGWLVCQYRE